MACLVKGFLHICEALNSDPQITMYKARLRWCVSVNPALGRQRWADPRSLLASESCKISELQVQCETYY